MGYQLKNSGRFHSLQLIKRIRYEKLQIKKKETEWIRKEIHLADI